MREPITIRGKLVEDLALQLQRANRQFLVDGDDSPLFLVVDAIGVSELTAGEQEEFIKICKKIGA